VFKLNIMFVMFKIDVQDVQIFIIVVGEGKLFGNFSSVRKTMDL